MPRLVDPSEVNDDDLAIQGWIGRPGYIPIGCLTMLYGRDGTGKTSVACDIAARRTRGLQILEPAAGEPLFDVPAAQQLAPINLSTVRGERDILRRRTAPDGEPGAVLIVTNEEHAESEVIPRMQAMGADRSRYRVIDDDDGTIILPDHMSLLAEAAQTIEATLIVLDTVLSMIRRQDMDYFRVRQVLQPLRQLARELGAGVLMLNHLDKFGRFAMGSTGLLAICRSRLLAEIDPDAREPYQFVLRPQQEK